MTKWAGFGADFTSGLRLDAPQEQVLISRGKNKESRGGLVLRLWIPSFRKAAVVAVTSPKNCGARPRSAVPCRRYRRAVRAASPGGSAGSVRRSVAGERRRYRY